MPGSLGMRPRRVDGRLHLLSPEVGWFTRALPAGASVSPGHEAGTLLTLGREFSLVAPEGAGGVIASRPPERARQPVGVGDVLYVLEAVAPTRAAASSAPAAQDPGADLVFRAPQAGRFYHRPAPGEPPFVAPGQAIEDGQIVGLIEVMKTFAHVPYRATAGLPRRAKLARWLAADGADVKSGEALFEVE